MRFTLQEWNLINEALWKELNNVNTQLKTAGERNEETRELLDKQYKLMDLVAKLEHNEI